MSKEIPVNLIYEDALSGAILHKLISLSGSQNWQLGLSWPAGGRAWIQSRIKGLNNAAKGMPYLILVDINSSYQCAPELVSDWIGKGKNTNLLLRVAVREVESWILASGNVFCVYLGVKYGSIPKTVDEISNPKEFLISLAKKSRKKKLQVDIVPREGSTAKVGPDYNGRLIYFVNKFWNPDVAADNSPSLKNTIQRLKKFSPIFKQKKE
jgi:hypothetical protein